MPTRTALALKKFATMASSVFRPRMAQVGMVPVNNVGSWFSITDWTAGAFQRDLPPVNTDRVMQNWCVYACLSLISGDLGKLRIKLVELGDDNVWREVRSAAFSPVLHKPNHYETRQKFVESWILSKLGPAGNTYVLKERDRRGIVVAMYVLDPQRVTPLIAPDGSVFYALGTDVLNKLEEDMQGIDAVPASEIIHDRAACLFHRLIGISPIYAAGLAAMQGLSMLQAQDEFFRARSMPGGVITAPREISQATLERLKSEWQSRYAGANVGKTAILGDGLKYEALSFNQKDSQLIEQMGVTAKMICSTYHVPPFKIGLESLPAGQKVGDMNLIYYSDCLQVLIESIEALLDEGLGLEASGKRYGTEFEVENLLRMDEPTRAATAQIWIGAGVQSPNEARLKENYPAAVGGESPYLQQQNYSLAALAKRDASEDPFATAQPAPEPEPEVEEEDQTEEAEQEITALASTLPSLIRKAA